MHNDPTYNGYIDDETDALRVSLAIIEGYLPNTPKKAILDRKALPHLVRHQEMDR